MKKLLALLLAVMMVLSLVACSTPAADDSTSTPDTSSTPDSASDSTPVETTTYENKVILGNTTELSGDFRVPGYGASSANAADQAIWFLTANDYSTMQSDQGGAYQWNQTVVKEHSETANDDGSVTYTVTINDDLKFSDGSPITIKNYLASTMGFSTPVAPAAGYQGVGSQSVVGYDDYKAYTGPDSAAGNKVFTGVRMLDDYTLAVTVKPEYAESYFAYTNGAFDCRSLPVCLGEDVDIIDDGDGCYLTDNFYETNDAGDYVKADELAANRYDLTKYPYCGAYVVSDWDEGTHEATLTINPEFKGNFEGQKPSVETIVYVKIVEETQLDKLKTGGVDVLSGITGGDATKEALAIVDGESFAETHYQRAGYGKIQFDCDFGPTMFQEVRQAVAYLLNRNEFCQTFTGGYGVIVDGPYCPDFTMWKAVQDDIDLIDYSYSPDTAIKVLEDGGWIYNSKGEPYEEGGEGVDAVRYKKLSPEEATEFNINFATVANTDGVEYKTVQVDGEYYMPLAFNWFGTEENTVTDMLTTMLANSSDVAAAGMVVRPTTGDFPTLLGNIYRDPSQGYGGTPLYGMYNLATGWNNALYDQSYGWSLDPAWEDYSANRLHDPYDVDFPYDLNGEKLTYEEAVAASDGKLGMDYLSMAMIYNAKTEDEYNLWWMGYIERFNQLMPDIPLYSNYYYDVYNAKIENFVTSPFFGDNRAVLYANVKGYAPAE